MLFSEHHFVKQHVDPLYIRAILEHSSTRCPPNVS